MLLFELLDLPATLHQISLLVLRLLLQVIDVALLVHSQDMVVWRTHIVLEVDAVLEVIREVPLRL